MYYYVLLVKDIFSSARKNIDSHNTYSLVGHSNFALFFSDRFNYAFAQSKREIRVSSSKAYRLRVTFIGFYTEIMNLYIGRFLYNMSKRSFIITVTRNRGQI